MKKILVAAGLVFAISGCYNDKYDKLYPAAPATTGTTCDTTGTIKYATDIKPIIVTNCYSPGNGCHDAAGKSTSGYDYQTSTTDIISNAQSGALLGDLNSLPRHNPMPKNAGKLADCDINKITRWVDEGAPNN